MKPFTLEEIAAACGGTYVGSDSMKTAVITSVERDSRQIKDGSLFLAIKGERVDGHDFPKMLRQRRRLRHLRKSAPSRRQAVYSCTLYLRRGQKNRQGVP